MYEFTISKKTIITEAKARDAKLRAEALEDVHNQISGWLQEALKEATENGKEVYSTMSLTLPDYFRCEKDDSYMFPEEIAAALEKVGFRASVAGKHFTLF